MENDTKRDTMTPAICDFHRFRDLIADFMLEAKEIPGEIRRACEENDWNDEVAYDMRDAMVSLGSVIATLTRWEHMLGLTPAQLAKIKAAEERRS